MQHGKEITLIKKKNWHDMKKNSCNVNLFFLVGPKDSYAVEERTTNLESEVMAEIQALYLCYFWLVITF